VWGRGQSSEQPRCVLDSLATRKTAFTRRAARVQTLFSSAVDNAAAVRHCPLKEPRAQLVKGQNSPGLSPSREGGEGARG